MIIEWEPPATLSEAFTKRRTLIANIQEMQNQLGDPRKRWTYEIPDDYWTWRQSVKWAMTNRLQELRLTKDWIHEHADRPLAPFAGTRE